MKNAMNMVTVRNLCLGDGIPKICIPITAATFDELTMQAQTLLQGPCDLVEWRVDFYNETAEGWMEKALLTLRKMLGEIPLLFTFRTQEEGGEKPIAPEDYRNLNLAAAATGLADMVDVELNRGEAFLQTLAADLQKAGVKVVGSYHDFHKTPEAQTIVGLLVKMQELGADVTKTAFMPQQDRDVMNLLDASLQMKEEYADRPYITMSMSRMGSLSRLAGALTGSAVTFATAGKASAPGQMDAELVQNVLRVL